MNLATAILLSYLLGSVPFAFILAKVLKNVDLRKVGSGNIGATNLVRALGFKIGIVGLLLDISKGIIPIIFLADLTTTKLNISSDSLRLILGLTSICGHNWTVFLKFKGGKGIATTFGVLIGLAIKNILIAKAISILALVWFVTFFIWQYVSLASIVSALSLPILLYVFKLGPDVIFFGIIMSVFAIFRHKSNILRLIQHKENRLDIKSKIQSLQKKALS
ncbi:MAG: glycerol-3-phosphate 1-O-acyltransferase PlsY [Candidatus Omnitrophica bacterium]|nr:glycerol-3-phosphate 1-O-acyltransferase PlsY [Candidatus Omnitrophota bacterium]MDD5352320.1 glycerol-3-phosphate 1-O-acyltransferase PlsY [Candidatus Omnitrophota bacterium]MDD5549918.1 glycerol-3-phosphate 1-O-acyltransferase PlsY [Candidatus Omnitrophota bacterium]